MLRRPSLQSEIVLRLTPSSERTPPGKSSPAAVPAHAQTQLKGFRSRSGSAGISAMDCHPIVLIGRESYPVRPKMGAISDNHHVARVAMAESLRWYRFGFSRGPQIANRTGLVIETCSGNCAVMGKLSATRSSCRTSI